METIQKQCQRSKSCKDNTIYLTKNQGFQILKNVQNNLEGKQKKFTYFLT
jgi:hypothetical protein